MRLWIDYLNLTCLLVAPGLPCKRDLPACSLISSVLLSRSPTIRPSPPATPSQTTSPSGRVRSQRYRVLLVPRSRNAATNQTLPRRCEPDVEMWTQGGSARTCCVNVGPESALNTTLTLTLTLTLMLQLMLMHMNPSKQNGLTLR